MKRGLKLQYFASKNSCFFAATQWESLKLQPGSRMEVLGPPGSSPCTHWHPVLLGWGPAGRKIHGGGDWADVLVKKKKKQKSYLTYCLLEIVAHYGEKCNTTCIFHFCFRYCFLSLAALFLAQMCDFMNPLYHYLAFHGSSLIYTYMYKYIFILTRHPLQ